MTVPDIEKINCKHIFDNIKPKTNKLHLINFSTRKFFSIRKKFNPKLFP